MIEQVPDIGTHDDMMRGTVLFSAGGTAEAFPGSTIDILFTPGFPTGLSPLQLTLAASPSFSLKNPLPRPLPRSKAR